MSVSDVLPVNPSFVVPVNLVHNVIVSKFDSGQEQRKQKSTYPKRSASIRTEVMTAAEVQTLRNFNLAMGGPFEVFSYLPPINLDRLLIGISCGTGDGLSKTFYPLGSSTPAFYYRLYLDTDHRNVVYIDGSAQEEGSFTLINDDVNNRSSILFDTAPDNGAVISMDVDRYYIARFLENEFSMQLEHYGIGSAEYSIIEVFRSSI